MTQKRIWINQADRKLSNNEAEWVEKQVNSFLNNWQAHGKPLAAKAHILHNLFLIIELNRNQAEASGCSIDALTRFVMDMENLTSFTFFNRLRTAYKKNGEVIDCSLDELKDLYTQGVIDKETVVFNPLVDDKNKFNTEWELKLGESWHVALVD